MHNSFTPRYDQAECPHPEEHGGWQATVFRTMKALGASLGVSHENSVFDLGEKGDNGKGVLPGCVKKRPEWILGRARSLQAAGRPLSGHPESEKSIAIKSIWVKLLADQSTRWVARTLYKQEHEFRIPSAHDQTSIFRHRAFDVEQHAQVRPPCWPPVIYFAVCLVEENI